MRYALACFLGLGLGLPAFGQGLQGYATVEIFIKPCDFQTRQPFAGAKLRYSISSASGATVASQDIAWNSRDKTQLAWTTRVPAGVYRYSVYSNVHPADLPCIGAGYFAVLPGALKRIDAGLGGGIGDPLAPLFIYGTAPRDVKVTVIRFDSRPDCGSPLSDARYHSINIERDRVGYYAGDSSLSGRGLGENVAFGVRVQRPGQGQRTFRVLASYPKDPIAVPPTSVRVDLTASVFDRAYKSGAAGLGCI
jgi:hypothetical protein